MSTKQITQKKLKAIVFTDMADFTQISAQDEENALDLIQKQNEIIKPIVKKHNGEWLKEIGDGLLFSFDSSLEAVRCSIEIQETLKDIDKLNIRIGIHQGDIFIKDGDVFGDDVNIASRVEGFAPIGGISLSDKVHKDISSVSDIKTSFIGHKKLKGVEQETRIRCITSHNLPINKKSNAPIIAAYLCFFMSASFFLRFGFHPITELYLANDPRPIKDYSFAVLFTNESMTFMIKYFVYGLSYLLIGYSCLSYYKGLSAISQKLLVLLAYVCVLSPIVLLIFNPEAQALNAQMINSVWLMSSSLLLFFVVLPIVIIILFKTYYYMKKHSSLNLFNHDGLAFMLLILFIILFVSFILLRLYLFDPNSFF